MRTGRRACSAGLALLWALGAAVGCDPETPLAGVGRSGHCRVVHCRRCPVVRGFTDGRGACRTKRVR